MKAQKNNLMHEPARRSARLTVQNGHRERHRYRSRLCTRQHRRDHRVPVGRIRDRNGSSDGCTSAAADGAEKSERGRLGSMSDGRKFYRSNAEQKEPLSPPPAGTKVETMNWASRLLSRTKRQHPRPTILGRHVWRAAPFWTTYLV
jgi:hypothetical protein